MPPTYAEVLSWGYKEPGWNHSIPQKAFLRGKDRVGALRWRKTRPCRRGLCIAIGLCVLRGLRSLGQTSSLISKDDGVFGLTILSAARSTFAT